MESSHLVIFSTSGKFITKFNVLRCISLSEILFWTGARGRIPITVTYTVKYPVQSVEKIKPNFLQIFLLIYNNMRSSSLFTTSD